MTIAKNIEAILAKSSWIRKMFEEGARLKALHGADKVYDFSLGNPNLEPPDEFQQALKEAVNAAAPGRHGYMPNSGYPEVCEAVAGYLSQEQDIRITGKEIVMTCGAAGALNVILKTILDPGDEIIAPAPYFVEYNFYASNHGGVLKTVSTRPDFTLDCEAIRTAISAKTKAVLINSPNNPTGQIYTKESLMELGDVLRQQSRKFGRTIYLVSDEPYRKIVYDGAAVPSIFACYPESMMATSYSKDISVPGERIGFIAVGPEASPKNELMAGMSLANRILGFVSAPALMQRAIAAVQGISVNVSVYARKRNLLCEGLAACGYEFTKPAGAFYLFPKSPDPDDVKFVRMLQEELILTVPGSGFGGPGHFRIAYCVDDNTIRKALPGFKQVMEKYKRSR